MAVVSAALKASGVDPESIGYVEAHGTATAVGDPIEVAALREVFGAGRPAASCAIGSVKGNIGHAVQAAGIASLFKVALMLENRKLVPSVNFEEPNPRLELDQGPLYVSDSLSEWESDAGVLRAGISSFGVGGTNAHLIVEEAPRHDRYEESAEQLPVPVGEEQSRPRGARRTLHRLPGGRSAGVAGRRLFHQSGWTRPLSVPGGCRSRLCPGSGPGAEDARAGRDRDVRVWRGFRPTLNWAFSFRARASQYVGMGRQLYETQPIFRRILDECDELLRPHLDRPLLSVLYPPEGSESPLDQTAYTQPALFAIEYATAMLWRSWGVRPEVLVGTQHPVSIRLPVSPGSFHWRTGSRLIARRGRLMQQLPDDGAMLAVFADEARVRPCVEPFHDRVSVAAINGPEQVVVSGDRDRIRQIAATFAEQGVETRDLTVSHAFHSPLMKPVLEEFRSLCAEVEFSEPEVPILTKQPRQAGRRPRSRRRTTGSTRSSSPSSFWPVSKPFSGGEPKCWSKSDPSPLCSGWPDGLRASGSVPSWPVFRPGRPDQLQILESLGALYQRGITVDWDGFNGDSERGRRAGADLPLSTPSILD